MNLKTAARRLGVHYQTAYRYVRSGDLVAVRVGSGYEISEAALEMARVRLEAAERPMSLAELEERRRSLAAAASAGDDIDILVEACTLSAQPVFDAVSRRIANDLGDAAAVLLLTHDEQWLQAVSSADPDPARHALFVAVHAVSPLQVADRSPHSGLGGHTNVVHHLRADEALRLLPPQFRGHADRLLVQSYISAPIARPDGGVDGVLVVMRFVGGAPYSTDDVAEVERLAGRVAAAIAHTRRYTAAWLARDNLRQSLEQLAAVGSVGVSEVSDTLIAMLDDDVPEAVFAPDRALVAANDRFMEAAGGRAGQSEFGVCGCAHGALMWERLLSGATDYLSTGSAECVLGQEGLPPTQWAVIRRPDATPFAVVAVLEPDATVASGATACWGPCA